MPEQIRYWLNRVYEARRYERIGLPTVLGGDLYEAPVEDEPVGDVPPLAGCMTPVPIARMPPELPSRTNPDHTYEGVEEGHARIDQARTQTQSNVDRAEGKTIEELLGGIDLALDGWRQFKEDDHV